MEICEEIQRENYMQWHIRRKEEEKRKKEEENRESERIQRLEIAKEKKKKLLEKIERKQVKKSPIGKDREWIKRKQKLWRKYREDTEMNEEEENQIYNKLIEKIPIRHPKPEVRPLYQIRSPKLRLTEVNGSDEANDSPVFDEAEVKLKSRKLPKLPIVLPTMINTLDGENQSNNPLVVRIPNGSNSPSVDNNSIYNPEEILPIKTCTGIY